MIKKNILFVLLLSFAAQYLQAKEIINVFLIGPGLVGSELIHQMQQHPEFEFHLVGLANSKKMLIDVAGINLQHWKDRLEQSSERMDLGYFLVNMSKTNLAKSVFVDATASLDIARVYDRVLEQGIPVVTPNKKANSYNLSYYNRLKKLSVEKRVPFLYEANVGAGLPIIKAVKDLRRSGDKVERIEAILSGTLSYIFNSFDQTRAFSEVVADAQTKGFTEPDPRDDLNAMDMARKALIIARELGWELEMTDIQIDNFLSKKSFEASSVDEFYNELKKQDGKLASAFQEVANEKKVWRYIANLEDGKIHISLKSVGQDHPFYNLMGTENIISITSQYYNKYPLVIKGPGAGAAVTASKVLANIVEAVGL